MASCIDCVHVEACNGILNGFDIDIESFGEQVSVCKNFKDRARFVELPEDCKPTADLKIAVRRLAQFYTMALETEYVKAPLPWALYKTWKCFDILSRKKERENNAR